MRTDRPCSLRPAQSLAPLCCLLLACALFPLLPGQQAASLSYSVNLKPGVGNATCGWYTLQYQTWCNASALTYVTTHDACNPTLPATGANCPATSPPLSAASSPCNSSQASLTCVGSVGAPNTLNLCLVVLSPASSSGTVLCDISVSGSTAPDSSSPDSGSGWAVWQYVLVVVGGVIAACIVILLMAVWFWYCLCWPDAKVMPEKMPPAGSAVVDMAMVVQDRAARYPGDPAPPGALHPPAYFQPAVVELDRKGRVMGYGPQPGLPGAAGKPGAEVPLFHTWAYPAAMTQVQPGKVPRPGQKQGQQGQQGQPAKT